MSKKLIDPRLVRARGPEIAALQRAAGLSDTALAGKASTSASTIRNAKQSRFLRLDSLNGIAHAFGVELADIADLNEKAPYRNRAARSEDRASGSELVDRDETDRTPDRMPLPVVVPAEPSVDRGAGVRHRLARGTIVVAVLSLLLMGAPLAIYVANPVAKSGPFAVASVTLSAFDDCARFGIGCTPSSIQHQDDRASDQTGSIEKPLETRREETPSQPAHVAGAAVEPGAHFEQEPVVVASADMCVPTETVQVEIKIDETSAQLPALVPCEWKTKIPFSERWIKTKGICAQGTRTVTAKVPQVTVRQPSRCAI